MVARCWESDCINYMISGSIDYMLSDKDRSSKNYYEIVQKTIEDHGIEASISKVVGSETLAYVADEGVQIFGGAGFIEEYPMACTYRDERINRIFEGTNEINRLIIGGTVLKKAILEEIPLRSMIEMRSDNWIPDISDLDEKLHSEIKVVECSRSFTLYCIHESIKRFGQDLKNEQWILEPLSDMLISLCIMDTGVKRYLQIKDSEYKEYTLEVLLLSIADNYEKCYAKGIDIVHVLFDGESCKNKISMIDGWYSKTNFLSKRIESQKRIVNRLYKKKKYYMG